MWVWGRPSRVQESPGAQPAQWATRSRGPPASAGELHGGAVTLLGAGERAFPRRCPVDASPARLQPSVSSGSVGAGLGCTDFSQLLRRGEGWAQCPRAGHRSTRTHCGQLNMGARHPSHPLSPASRSLGKHLMGTNLSQVLHASLYCLLLLWVSSPFRRCWHAASMQPTHQPTLATQLKLGNFLVK